MSSYLNVNELAESPTFRGRIQAAIAVYASGVLGETDKPARQAEKRRTLAEEVLVDPAPKVNAFVWLIVTNGTVRDKGHAVEDGDLEWVVGWAWDRVAGVTEADTTSAAAATAATTAQKRA
jgi:hypothetical protein